MRKQRLTFVTIGVGMLILLVVFFFASTAVRRSGHVKLPEQSIDIPGSDETYQDTETNLPLLEITPDTVQQAIATLNRPESYARTVTITTFWEEGSATDKLDVAVMGDMTRIDTPVSGGSIRHVLTNGVNSAVWYDEETSWRVFPAGNFTADREQRIPTYEDILALSVEEIAVAVYGEYEEISCISVLTAEDSRGYHTAYWVSLESGLLVAAEVFSGDELVYRMTSLSLSSVEGEELFLLPDGSELSHEGEMKSDEPILQLPEKPEAVKPPSQVVSPGNLIIG